MVNNYYDDMAWLALSTLRLEKLAEETRKPGRPARNARVRKSLTLQFDSASTDDLGGGTFWSTKRDFKNTPATAPVALYYARTGNPAKAQALLDWLDAKLYDPARACTRTACGSRGAARWCWKSAIYTYNQGPVLGALLELGGEANLERAAALVDAVARHLTPAPAPLLRARRAAVLRCDGTGDGGLFTGILGPVPCPRRRRRTASRPRPGPRPPRWSTKRPRPSGRAAGILPARTAWRARAATWFSPSSPNCRRAAAIRRAPPSNFPPSSRPGWCWRRPRLDRRNPRRNGAIKSRKSFVIHVILIT